MPGGIRETALSKLLAFAFQPAFDSDHAVAETLFWRNLPRTASPGETTSLIESEDGQIKYNTWFLFDWEADGEGSVADVFLEDEAAQLSAPERRFLERLAYAHLRLYEVEAVREDGLRLLDLWTGVRMDVVEHTAVARIAPWDLLGARVAPDGGGGNVFEGGLYLYPADTKTAILAHFRKLHRRYQRKHPGEDSRSFFRAHALVFHHLWLDLVVFPPPPRLTTSEGDPLIFCRVVFDAPRLDEVRALLLASPEVKDLGDRRLGWFHAGPDGPRELGSWSIDGTRLVFETMSQERAARGRAWIEALAGPDVRYRGTTLEPLELTFRELRKPRLAAPPPPLDAADLDAVQELYDRHYSAWLDRSEPALGNRTPREAVRSRLWRSRVMELLKQLENTDARAARQGRPRYDFAWVWRELGVERPG